VFSGIIECVGTVAAIRRSRGDAELTLTSGFRGLVLGESIAVNGACMTVTTRRGSRFTVLVSAESLRRTTLGALRPGDVVNLERSLRLGDRLSGHFVFGHVDGVGTVEAIEPEGGSALYRFSLPSGFGRFLVEKGSIAVDGVALTIADLADGSFAVALVPHTLAATTLSTLAAGRAVNLEADLLAKYVERLLEPHTG
jgi:riboflavin synthase